MRRLAVAAVLGLALGVVPTLVFAQAKPAAAPPKPSAPAAAIQKPAVPAPVPPAAPAAAATRPFPAGATIAFLDIQRVAAESSEGKAATTRVSALREKKLAELGARNKQLEAAQAKVNQPVLSEEARAAAQKEIDKLNIEIQRAQQDADAEMQELQQQLQGEFQRKLSPVIQQVAIERGLLILLSRADAGMIWADPGLDLTADVIKKFDAATAGVKPPSH
jgi:outer membrane protein